MTNPNQNLTTSQKGIDLIKNFKFFVLGALFLSFLVISSSSCAKSESEGIEANNASNEEIKKQRKDLEKKYTYNCVNKHKGKLHYKYRAYEDCIGELSKDCNGNYDKFIKIFGDQGMGRTGLECYNMEITLWVDFFDEESSKLLKNAKFYLKEDKIIKATEDNIKALRNTPGAECAYLSTKWRKGTQNIYDNFRCGRDNIAESAIKIFLWNNELETHKGKY